MRPCEEFNYNQELIAKRQIAKELVDRLYSKERYSYLRVDDNDENCMILTVGIGSEYKRWRIRIGDGDPETWLKNAIVIQYPD